MGNGLTRPRHDAAPEGARSAVRLARGAVDAELGADPVERILELVGATEVGPLQPDGRADLLSAIHERVIPQLMLAHVPDRSELSELEACPGARLPPTTEEVAHFSRLATAEDLQAALAYVEVLAGDGLSVEVILLHLVAPAARLLGDEWLDDRRSFTEVTLGLNTLHQVVHILGPSFAVAPAPRGSVILVAAPAEQHTLGIYLLAEFLRRDGWGVQVDPNMPLATLLSLVKAEHVEMVGISVSNTDLVAPLTRMVSSVRKASKNTDLTVMLGGSLALAGDAEAIGATFCNDPFEAGRLLERRARRSR